MNKLVIEGMWLEVLIEKLILWEQIESERDQFTNWKRSAIERENRRESIAYGHCLETMKWILGRQAVSDLMKAAKASDKLTADRIIRREG